VTPWMGGAGRKAIPFDGKRIDEYRASDGERREDTMTQSQIANVNNGPDKGR